MTLAKSIVWIYFIRINKNECTCNICEEMVKVKQGSTTNLHNYVKGRHGKAESVNAKKSAAITNNKKLNRTKKIKSIPQF